MLREIVYGVAAVVLLACSLEFLFSIGDDPREPPVVRPTIPLIGHVIGIMRGGPTYYSETSSKKATTEIHTLRIFNYKIYVSTSSRLLPMIQKQSKALSFRPFLQITARKHGDASDKTYEIYGTDLTDHLSHAVRTSLAPGPHLDEQNLRMANRVLLEVDNLLRGSAPSGGRGMQLLDWTRHLVVQASSCGVNWQNYLTAHLAGLDISGKGYAQRQIVYDAYIKYCRELPNDGSQLAREHKRVIVEAGVDEVDYAKQASLFTIAVFSNTAPTLYWTVYELFSRPDILAQVREELEAHAISREADGDSGFDFTLDVAALKTRCYVLLSLFQETQRTRHVNASFRKMPGGPIHFNTALWGADAAAFDPYRFVPRGEKHAVPGAARQFAAAEVLIATALLVTREQ
ncbi:Cytochrome P450 [Cordyceps militaris]|uniref:Cytochrome P450 n=1 Tax=Cordyceps militaris TaxID=73501 RepID=A0A2H4SMS1_CORMI|nr:Cytochrome P450 [Cordyceps militaris]